MFGFFKKKASGPTVRDMVWMSNKARNEAGLVLIQQANNPVVAAWFDETIDAWRTLFEAAGLSIEIHTMPWLQSLDVKDRTVFLLEHYPLSSKEIKAIQHWKPTAVMAFVSMEEPLLQLFGGDNLIGLMQKMGMNESEMIEHKMISRSIRKAQEKLEAKVSNERPATSQEEWFRANVEKYPKA